MAHTASRKPSESGVSSGGARKVAAMRTSFSKLFGQGKLRRATPPNHSEELPVGSAQGRSEEPSSYPRQKLSVGSVESVDVEEDASCLSSSPVSSIMVHSQPNIPLTTVVNPTTTSTLADLLNTTSQAAMVMAPGRNLGKGQQNCSAGDDGRDMAQDADFIVDLSSRGSSGATGIMMGTSSSSGHIASFFSGERSGRLRTLHSRNNSGGSSRNSSGRRILTDSFSSFISRMSPLNVQSSEPLDDYEPDWSFHSDVAGIGNPTNASANSGGTGGGSIHGSNNRRNHSRSELSAGGGTSSNGKGRRSDGGSGRGHEMLKTLMCDEEMRKALGPLIIDPMDLVAGRMIASGASGDVRKGDLKGQAVAVKVLKTLKDQGAKEQQAMVSEFRREVEALMAGGACPRLLEFKGVCVDARGRLCIVTKFMEGGSLSDHMRFKRHGSADAQSRGTKPQPYPRSASATTSSASASPLVSPFISPLISPRGCASGSASMHGCEGELPCGGSSSSSPIPLPLSDALHIACDVAEGMVFLHARGLIHRDLKPANVLLDKDGRAVIADFGVARLKDEGGGDMTMEVGTYRWMAPEAFGTGPWPVSQKSDVYSFGIVLWEMISGKLPFADKSNLQAAVAVSLHGLRPTVPGDCPKKLGSLIERCWDKDPNVRPEFNEVLSELRAIMEEMQDQER